MFIQTIQELRSLYNAPKERAIKKQLSALDVHCERFIALSPFAVLASSNEACAMDASPRGGSPGFIKVLNAQTLLIPDSPGNNRLDTLENVIRTGKIGLFFLIPGVDETLRINGSARISRLNSHMALFSNLKNQPKLVIEVQVAEAYLHCAKALMRSALWTPSSKIDRSLLPTMGQMINSHTSSVDSPETQEQMLSRYAPDLE
jgi:uncharacterized protein